jgi:ubiquinone/menaquinone biosynthesis C-methylase UbiE
MIPRRVTDAGAQQKCSSYAGRAPRRRVRFESTLTLSLIVVRGGVALGTSTMVGGAPGQHRNPIARAPAPKRTWRLRVSACTNSPQTKGIAVHAASTIARPPTPSGGRDSVQETVMTIAYHLNELKIQQDPDDPRNNHPSVPRSARRILDVGCGIGQTLATNQLPPEATGIGIDIDQDALAYGARSFPQFGFVAGSVERLPFGDQTFDFVYSRVALPWVHIPSALREMARVTSAGGEVWCSLVSFSTAMAELRAAARHRSLTNLVFRSYVLANGTLFHLTGRQVRFPLKRSRCESFQTVRSMRRAMSEAGLSDVQIGSGKFFVMTGKKPA